MVGFPSIDASLIPPLIILSIPAYLLASRLYNALVNPSSSSSSRPYDPATGIGRGAPGFQTNTRKVQLPAELVARIKRGEEVSAEEVTAALDKQAQQQEEQQMHAGQIERTRRVPERVDQDWLPKQQGASGGAGGRRRKR
ncbi:hypothetical protein OIV83_001104 [Microbotryomycetes sp. JL201]|nr:hypothetical protein OIV83_001104 [Microbotryomycetes sp. JL201]